MLIFFYIILVCCLLYTLGKILLNVYVNQILKFVIIFYSLLWVIIPSLITIIRPELYDLYISVNLYLIYAIIEITFTTVILIFFHVFTLRRATPHDFTCVSNKGFLVFSLIVLTLLHLSSLLQGNYIERNDLSNSSTLFTTLAPFISIFTSAVYFNIIQLIIFRRRPNILDLISILFVLFLIGKDIQMGSRIILLLPIFIVTLIVVYTQKSLVKKTLLLFTLIILSFISLNIVVYISQVRQEDSLVEISVSDLESEMSKNNTDTYLQELVVKLNSIHDGAILVTFSGRKFAGFNPYKGALLAFIPRAVFPNKPIPGSYNSSVTGTPARYTASLKGLNPEISNLGISASGISIWQFGVFGVFLCIILNIVNMLIMNNLLSKNSYFLQLLGFSLFQLHTFLLIRSGDTIIRNWITLMVVYLLIIIVVKSVRLTYYLIIPD